MTKLYIVIFVLSCFSCAQSMLVEYQVLSSGGDFEVAYSGVEPEIHSDTWNTKFVSDGEVFLLVTPKEQNQIIDVRVFAETGNGKTTYKRVVSDRRVLIDGKIRVR